MPSVVDSAEDHDQELATWTLQCMHAQKNMPDNTVFMAPVLFGSHWSPIALRVAAMCPV